MLKKGILVISILISAFAFSDEAEAKKIEALEKKIEALEKRISEGKVYLGNNSFMHIGNQSQAIGSITSTANRATAIGEVAQANSWFSIAIGREAQVGSTLKTEEKDLVLGGDSVGSIAIGKFSKVFGKGSVAIGRDTEIIGNDSVAIGTLSDASEDRVVSFGRSNSASYNGTPLYAFQRRLINVADGINEHDAVTVRQLKELPVFKYEVEGINSTDLLYLNNKLYNINGLVKLSDGNYYNSEKIKGLSLGTDHKFYSEDLSKYRYVGSIKDKEKGYYSIEDLKMHEASGNIVFKDEKKESAKPIKPLADIKSVELEDYKIDKSKASLSIPTIENNAIRLKNIGKGIEDTDAVNVSQLKELNDKNYSGIANAMAMAGLPQSSNKFGIYVSYGMYNGSSAFALGVNGKKNNFSYRLNTGIDTSAKIGLSMGVGYEFGSINNNDEITLLKEKIKELEAKIK